jgi:class 3 adenylate cyclase/tetratricopeptide (TPR) repeat protein
VVCPRCEKESRAGAKFCADCGTPLAGACQSCGAAYEPGARFCAECGAALGGGEPAVAAAAMAATPVARTPTERRLVSVLFADLVGFTNLSEERDSEDVRALQSRYFDAARRLIELYGGTVEKFIGDAVMAVWGTPTATEDDAERAVRAALDLVAAVSALGDELGLPELRARAGVLTGEATVTLGAEGQGMVAGDVVNTASRIQAMAGSGQVLVGDTTRRSTEPTVVYQDAGSHELKGKAGLHRLWRAMRVVSGARGALKSEGLEAPFVGRDRELRQIKDLFHASADERKAHLVSVTGIAGIGKSRLVWEFYKYFDGLPQIVYWHRGRCLSYGEGVTYWALADMVRMRCRIAEDEDALSATAKLDEVVAEHIHDVGERAFVAPRVAHLVGLDEGSSYQREELFAAWRLFFERLADVHPTVLAFEDMQWADASLLDFIEHLLEWSRQSPLFVLTSARPELLERRLTWGAAKRNFTSMYLEPLPAPAMRELLEGLAAGLPAGLRDQILARAEGVPLYAVETVRMLIDRGLLVERGSVYELAGEVGSLEVPETLHALIAARLDGLDPRERRVVQDGAVLGKTFTKAALGALMQVPEAEIEPVLIALVRKEVLSIQADPRSPEHGQYGFLQDLVRRVAYETLSRRERHTLHLAAADYLESAFPDEDEIVEVLASHYLDAYRAMPDAEQDDAVRRRTRELLVRAAEHAAALGASSQAQRYFANAAELADDQLQRAGLLDQAGDMAQRAGELEVATALFEQALEILEQAGETHAAARVVGRLAWVDQAAGRFEQAINRMESAYAALSADPADADLALLASRLGHALAFMGDMERARDLAERALDIGEALGLAEPLVRSWITKAQIGIAGGHPGEARALLRAALELAVESGATERASVAAGNLSDLSFQRDRYHEALAYLEQSLELARTIGHRPNEWFAFSEMTYPLFILGRWEEAIAAFSELPEEHLATGGTLLSPMTSVVEIHIHRGKVDRGRRLHDVYQRLESSPDRQESAGWAASLAALLHAEGRHAEAVAAGRRAFEARETLGSSSQAVKQGFVWAVESALAMGDEAEADELLTIVEGLPPGLRPPLLQAHARRFRARMGGSAGTAGADFAAAAQRYRDIEAPFWLAVTRLEQAEWLARTGRPEEVDVPLGEAREIFGRLDARPWVERAEALSDEIAAASQMTARS